MFTIQASLRIYIKKRATRRLRKTEKCPANIYGKSNEPNLSIVLNQNEISHPSAIKQLYKNNILILFIKKQPITVKIQEIQQHHFKPKIIHIDFVRV